LGPIGQMTARIARHRGARVIGVDLVPERLELARRYDVEVVDLADVEDAPAAIREMTEGRGTDSVIEAVGMEAHGAPFGKLAQQAAGLLPDAVATKAIEKAGVDRLRALIDCIDAVRRGGTISIVGVYGGMLDPLPMMQLFDKGIQLRMGQAHVKRWIPALLPLVSDESDPLGTEDLATHALPLEQAPRAYEMFQKKQEGAIKILLRPSTS
jgi:threonine dehydrogenase-like Zn-dependent dehydrogenase